MKIALTIIALLNGLWMLADGIHVMLKGKYMGPPQPGPWRKVFEFADIDPLSLGPLFIVFGVAWLVSIIILHSSFAGATHLAMAIAVASLWYLPVGTLLSVVFIVLLWMMG